MSERCGALRTPINMSTLFSWALCRQGWLLLFRAYSTHRTTLGYIKEASLLSSVCPLSTTSRWMNVIWSSLIFWRLCVCRGTVCKRTWIHRQLWPTRGWGLTWGSLKEQCALCRWTISPALRNSLMFMERWSRMQRLPTYLCPHAGMSAAQGHACDSWRAYTGTAYSFKGFTLGHGTCGLWQTLPLQYTQNSLSLP